MRVIGGAVAAAALPLSTRAQQLTQAEVYYDPDAPVLGNPKGNVTLVQFFDYQCPYCKKSHADVEAVVKADGNVRLVMKDWPIFGDSSVFASQAVLGAASLGQYEQAMEPLMATPGALSEEDVKSILSGAGFDLSKLAAAVNKNFTKISGLLERNFNQAAAFGFAGTPAFVIGTGLYSGVLDQHGLRNAIALARKA